MSVWFQTFSRQAKILSPLIIVLWLFGTGCGRENSSEGSQPPNDDPRKVGYLVDHLYDYLISTDQDFFDKVAQMYQAQAKSYTGTTIPSFDVAFEYDEKGRITKATKTADGQSDMTTYTYDGERIAEVRETVSGAEDTVVTPSYNEQGKLIAYSKSYFGSVKTRTLQFDTSDRLLGVDIQPDKLKLKATGTTLTSGKTSATVLLLEATITLSLILINFDS